MLNPFSPSHSPERSVLYFRTRLHGVTPRIHGREDLKPHTECHYLFTEPQPNVPHEISTSVNQTLFCLPFEYKQYLLGNVISNCTCNSLFRHKIQAQAARYLTLSNWPKIGTTQQCWVSLAILVLTRRSASSCAQLQEWQGYPRGCRNASWQLEALWYSKFISWRCWIANIMWSVNDTRGDQKVKTIFKLRGKRDREELAHYAVLTMSIEEFSHVQYSALPSVEWQQRGIKHGLSFARLHHRRTTWRSAVSLGRRSETCGNSPSYVGSV